MPDPAASQNHVPSQLALLVVAIALLIPFLFHTGFHGDEFTNLDDAVRQLHGQVIYRDFFEFAAPLSSWIAAATFAITGPSVFWARFVQSAGLLLSAWQLYALARRLESPPWLATLPGVVLIAALYRAWPGYSHHWILLPLVLGALQAAMNALDGDTSHWALAGILAGTATLDMQTDGPVLLVAMGAVGTFEAMRRRDTRKKALFGLGLFTVAYGLPLGIAAGYFWMHDALSQAWNLVWIWPMHHYKQPGGFNDISYGSDWFAEIQPIARNPLWLGRAFHLSCTYLLAPVAAIAGICWLSRDLLQRRWTDKQARLAVVLLLVLGELYLVTHGRADYPRIAIYSVPAVLMLTTAAAKCLRDWHSRALAIIPSVLLVAYAGTGVFLFSRYIAADPASYLTLTSPDQRIASLPVLEYLRDHTGPNDRLAVFPFGGVFYFYGRPPATRYTLIYPAKYKQMGADEIREAWHEIDANKPKFLVVGPYEFNGRNIADFFPNGTPAGYRRVSRTFEMSQQPVWLYERMAAVPSAIKPGASHP